MKSVSFSRPIRRNIWFASGVLGLLTLVAIAGNAEKITIGDARTPPVRSILAIEAALADDVSSRTPPADPIDVPEPLVIAVTIALGVWLLYLLSRQRFSFRLRRPQIRLGGSKAVAITEEDDAEAIADFARDLIDELNDGDSPRYAIQRAYAAVETGFGAAELTRKPAETPLRYLERIFGRHTVVQQPLEQLTELFQRARFSEEPIDEAMRSSAIAALSEIRDYYTTIAWNKISRRRSKVPA